MAHRRSRTDPVLGAVTIAVRPETDPALWVLLDRYPIGSTGQPQALVGDLMTQTRLNMPGTFVHEWAHVLQAAAYPMLYLRASREWRMVRTTWNYLAAHPGRYPLPIGIQWDADIRRARQVETAPARIEIRGRSVQVVPASFDKFERGVLVDNDLLEEDASIFQYRVERGGWGSGTDYQRWVNERCSYSAVFSFLRRYLPIDTAYALIPIAARVAYRTTDPLTALAIMVGSSLHEGDKHIDEENEDFWEFLMAMSVDRLLSPAADEAVGWTRHADVDAALITSQQMRRAVDAGSFLPINHLARRNVSDASVEKVLRRPWEHIAPNGGADECATSLLPPATVFELADPARLAISLHRSFAQLHPVAGAEFTFADVYPTMLQQKLMFDVQVGGRSALRVCPHQTCRVHGTDLCEGYFPVPREPEDCGFPDLFRMLTGMTVSSDGATLEPVQEG
ncbi:hypothetical protein ACWT_3964 [Actinoplanes sp. SE50]|uniref:hypothetical protein n=1 Tax=unclassified Actinoplanes TaxID=2626549 RepID=UPI00023ED450|nr:MULTISPECIES: hypothetical protein [unclassified Actinoplanes]AEV84988.1 hypothetical protein ACPL_4093 [Actinoplanes sp. SE50/110]ATO83379.1 hypothetical protein ACWT_3964 [Actinoplanes sp. SE50]SLM00786.1 hypothetical protein ACSP50_4019 [Actinoplanes sp. SE50/110]